MSETESAYKFRCIPWVDEAVEDALEAERLALDAEYTAVVAKRKAWKDAHMADYARYAIGTEVFWLRGKLAGARWGVITNHYRYWGDRDPQYDTSMSIEYEVQERPQCFGNSSGRSAMAGWDFGTKEEYAEVLQRELDRVNASPLGAPANG